VTFKLKIGIKEHTQVPKRLGGLYSSHQVLDSILGYYVRTFFVQ